MALANNIPSNKSAAKPFMTTNSSDIMLLWEESLIALSRYCVHYGLDDDDEETIRNYLAVCARLGHPANKDLTQLINSQGQKTLNDTPVIREMSILEPQWDWACFGEETHQVKVKKKDKAAFLNQLKAKVDIDLRKMTGQKVHGRFFLSRILHLDVTLVEMPEGNTVMHWIWNALLRRVHVKVMAHSRWQVIEGTEFKGEAISAKELLTSLQKKGCPGTLWVGSCHRIMDARLSSTLDDVELQVKSQSKMASQ